MTNGDAPKFATVEEEHDHLLQELGRVHGLLNGFSRAAYGKAQYESRLQAQRDNLSEEESIKRWIRIRNKMDNDRVHLRQKKLELELRLSMLRPALRKEREQASKSEPARRNLASDEVIQLLTEIRDLLEDRLPLNEDRP